MKMTLFKKLKVGDQFYFTLFYNLEYDGMDVNNGDNSFRMNPGTLFTITQKTAKYLTARIEGNALDFKFYFNGLTTHALYHCYQYNDNIKM